MDDVSVVLAAVYSLGFIMKYLFRAAFLMTLASLFGCDEGSSLIESSARVDMPVTSTPYAVPAPTFAADNNRIIALSGSKFTSGNYGRDGDAIVLSMPLQATPR